MTLAYKNLANLSPEEKKEQGIKLGELKNETTIAYEIKLQEFQAEAINAQLADDIVDISLDKPLSAVGHAHLLHKERRLIEQICQGMGFVIEY
ncbi:hypothetical protein KBC03_05160 [Patescibacteria group bacterium]|nr:hypothetical protein [Patescibacteria group bacterium]